MPYVCGSDDGNAPIVVVQKLVDDAEVVAWCAECWPQFISTAYQAMFPDDEPIPLVPTEDGADSDSDEDADADQAQPGPLETPPGPEIENLAGDPQDAEQPPVAVT